MKKNLKIYRKRLTNILLVLSMIFVLAGCGDSSTSSSSPSSSSASSEASTAGTTSDTSESTGSEAELTAEAKAELQAKFDALTGVPEFSFTADPIDAKTLMQGKKWMTIPGTSANPFNQTICEAMSKLGTQIGFQYDLFSNQGASEEYIAALDGAKAQGYTLVDLQAGPSPLVLKAQIQNCIDSGVKVVTSHLTDHGQKVEPVSANMGGNYVESGSLIADWAILNAGTDANVIVITSEEIISTAAMIDGINAEFAKYAPKATVKFINVPIVDWQDIQGELENALSADPNVDYILPIYDSMCQYVVPAVETAGSKAKIATYNGTPFVIDLLNRDKVEMVVGEDLGWIAYSTVDFEMRVANNLEPVEPDCAFRVWTKENVSEALNPSTGKCEYGIGYGDAYIEGYEKIWGLR